jgi:Ca2+-binding EF-hand superfamily protein
VLIFTLKFTTNQNEIEHLIKILFSDQLRTKLTKIDFFKIFSLLLPHDGSTTSLLMPSPNYIDEKNNNKNSNFPNNTIQSNMDYQYTVEKEKFKSNIKSPKLSNNDAINNLGNTNNNFNNKQKFGETNTILNTNRSLEELGKLVFEYKFKMGGQFSNLFKDLDNDGSLGIDKKELFNGYQKMGIALSENELNKLWRELSPDNKNVDFERFKDFHEKLFNPNKRKGHPIQRDQTNLSNNNDSNNSEIDGGFISQVESK